MEDEFLTVMKIRLGLEDPVKHFITQVENKIQKDAKKNPRSFSTHDKEVIAGIKNNRERISLMNEVQTWMDLIKNPRVTKGELKFIEAMKAKEPKSMLEKIFLGKEKSQHLEDDKDLVKYFIDLIDKKAKNKHLYLSPEDKAFMDMMKDMKDMMPNKDYFTELMKNKKEIMDNKEGRFTDKKTFMDLMENKNFLSNILNQKNTNNKNVLDLVNEKIQLMQLNEKNYDFAQNIAKKIEKLIEITSDPAPSNNNAPVSSKIFVPNPNTPDRLPVPEQSSTTKHTNAPTTGNAPTIGE